MVDVLPYMDVKDGSLAQETLQESADEAAAEEKALDESAKLSASAPGSVDRISLDRVLRNN